MSSMLSRSSWTGGLVALAAFTGLTTLQADAQPKEFVFSSFDVQGYVLTAPQGLMTMVTSSEISLMLMA